MDNKETLVYELAFLEVQGKSYSIKKLTYQTVIIHSFSKLENIHDGIIWLFDFSQKKYLPTSVQVQIKQMEKTQFYYCYQFQLLTTGYSSEYEFYRRMKTIIQYGKQKKNTKPAAILPSYGNETVDLVYVDSFEDILKTKFLTADSDKFENFKKYTFELAFTVSESEQYKACLEASFKKCAQNTLRRLHLQEHPAFSTAAFKRVYIGNEFCPRLLPGNDRLRRLIVKAKEEGLSVTVALPYMRQSWSEKFHEILSTLSEIAVQSREKIEVIINDFGLLHQIECENYSVIPVLGRMLNKQYKDPRSQWLSQENETIYSNGFNHPTLSEFLSQHFISRLEYESGNKDYQFTQLRSSLHLPFYHIIVSTYCHLYHKMMDFDQKSSGIDNCPGYCSDIRLFYPKRLNMFGVGNRLIGLDTLILRESDRLIRCFKSGVDRLVLSAY